MSGAARRGSVMVQSPCPLCEEENPVTHRRLLRSSLVVLATTTLSLGLLSPAMADPGIPEPTELSKRLGEGSNATRVAPEDEAPGNLAPGTKVPYVPFDVNYERITEVDKEESTANLQKVASLPAASTPGMATRSNLAFKGDYVYQGSYNGLAVYDVSNPEEPKVVREVICPGYQGDLSIAGDLLFFSVDQPRNGNECGAPSVPASSPDAWEGIRIYDISDQENPQYVNAVKTRCGSHTHTLVPNKDDANKVYLYNGSYDTSTSAAYCKNPHEQIEIIEVELDDPSTAAIAKEVKLWDAENPALTAADRPNGGANTSVTTGCHDLTAYPEKGLLAAACMGDGLLLDISDPLNPAVTERVRDENYAFWHTAQFNNAATSVIFQDELGGGSSATCVPGTPQYRGANAIFDLAGNDLTLKSYYKIPRRQATTENCVGHEGNIVQVDGKDVLVQAWYQGGASLIDFSNTSKPKEIGYFDRGPISNTSLVTGGYWAVYSHNGYLYGSEIARGLDVFKLVGDEFADANRHRQDVRNPATQQVISWPWKTAPQVSGELETLEATPASTTAGQGAEITVTAPAGTFGKGEYVEIWSTGDDAEAIVNGQAAADGSIQLSFQQADDVAPGTVSYVVRGDTKLDAKLYGFSVEVEGVATTTTLKASSTKQTYGTSSITLTATVAAEGEIDGTVTFKDGSTVIAKGVQVQDGTATIKLPADTRAGTRSLTAEFVPSGTQLLGSSSAATKVTVAKVASKVSRKFTSTIKTSTKPKVSVTVTAGNVTPTGDVTVRIGSKSLTGSLVKGKVSVTFPKLKKGTYTVRVFYPGTGNIGSSKSTNATLKVVK
ncbi:hypothetical protein GEV26_11195 [Aeromicrobium yanjiei]|uniref:Bacterial Ig-like domain-containing protein n=1 Tax=Aeromicrobium yanjiei TaxID=2662028 RepID=A0A5Q2MGW2_9ACTN|nr:hypothetical protein GEV26_11195 [Aeromicrobium yanjiei]